jgi:glycosyltransferase involved in cell wall biosynthesis
MAADLIHSTSTREQKILNAIGWNKNIYIIPNAVNIENVKATSNLHKKKTILYLGRIHPQKGINHLIEAIAILKDKILGCGYSVKIVGMGEDSYVNKLKYMCKKLNVDKIINIDGAVYAKVKWELFRESSLFILPSYSESFGIVVAEALASETPVITTQGTPWEEINGKRNPNTNAIEGKCGWWIKQGTGPLVHAIDDFLSTDESKLLEMGRNGHKLIKEHYSCNKVEKEFINIYNNLKTWKKI